jgi:KAP-like P-loop domain-containing protein
MLADMPLADDAGDRLGFKPFADAIAGVIDSPRTATPLVMAINAKWGAGKTTLGQMVKRRLETKSAADGYAPHVTCWFNSWMHDDAPILPVALAAEVAQVASRSRSFWRRILNPLPSSLSTARQRRLRKGFKYFGLLSVIVLAYAAVSSRSGHTLAPVVGLNPEAVKSLTTLRGGASLTALMLALLLLFHVLAAILPVAKSVAEFAKDPESAAKTASMPEVRSQLGKLIRQGTPRGSKFIIFIDDLDRCLPPRSVEVLEAINQLLDHNQVVVVLMTDMQVVARCAEVKYKDLTASETLDGNESSVLRFATYGWNYLQKIIQLHFDLPVYSERMIRQMVEALAKEVSVYPARGWLDAVWQRLQSRSLRVFSALRQSRLRFDLATLAFAVAAAFEAGRFFLNRQVLRNMRGLIVELLGVAIGVAIPMLAIRILLWVLESRRRKRIDEQIKARIAAGERDFSKVEEYVKRENSAWRNDPETEGLVKERLQRYLEDESELQREAEDEVMQHLEPMPRHAKRLLNRLRLLLFVAHERRMFGGTPELTPRHIGKWAVLGERWPELSQTICFDPSIMKRLENSETHDAAIKERVRLYEKDRALRHFCLSRAGVKLWPVIARIVEFVPSASPVRRSRQRTMKPTVP